MKISAVIAVHNESNIISQCLDSIHNLVDEIIVIDLDSGYKISDVAKKYKAIVIKHPFVDHVELIRNFMIEHAKNEWVLLLDPDEQVSDKLYSALQDEIQNPNIAAINIPRQNIFWGKWLKHSNFWPDYQLRLVKKGQVTWPTKIHTYPNISGETINLPTHPDFAILHYGLSNVSQFLTKHNRYSSIAASELQSYPLIQAVWQPLREIAVRYFRHLGFLDGYRGLFITYLLVLYRLDVAIKYHSK